MSLRGLCSSRVPPGHHGLQGVNRRIGVTQETCRDANASRRCRVFRAVSHVDSALAKRLDDLRHLVADANHDEVCRALPVFETETRARGVETLARLGDL